jgi:phage shock protein A
MSDEPARPQEPAVLEGELVQPIPADYSEDGVPSFDYVRDRIERRAAVADGATELAGESKDSIDEQIAERDRAARDKLAEIRRSLRGE